jgi:hypothetical protein
LLNAIAKKDSFAEGSVVLLYGGGTSQINNPILMQKKGRVLVPIELGPDTTESRLQFEKGLLSSAEDKYHGLIKEYGGLYLLSENK